MAQHHDYDEYSQWAQRKYSGHFKDAVFAEFEIAKTNFLRLPIDRAWWLYQGSDFPPVALYTRWQKHMVTIATIAGKGTQEGRLPSICKALEATNLIVRWENVSNQNLRYALLNRGYTSNSVEPCFTADLHRAP